MATTIKVDGTVQAFSWQDDQALEPLDPVDLVVPGNTGIWTPTSQVGKGGDGVAEGTAAKAKK